MPAGLEVYDGLDRLMDSITSKFSRRIGSIFIPAVRPTTVTSHAGSIVVPENGSGAIWWGFSMAGSTQAPNYNSFYPDVTISGSTLNWSFAMLTTEVDRVMLEEMFVYIGGMNLEYGRYV